MRIAVVGLGYVGLPVALALSTRYETVGFDTNQKRLEALSRGLDATGEVDEETLSNSSLEFSGSPTCLKDKDFIIVAVPTPIDRSRRPNLQPLLAASKTVGENMSPGTTVVFESTVYPGVTEEICGPAIQQASGLPRGQFKLAYSPERINPGDREHSITRITKVVSGEDPVTLRAVAELYGSVIEAGVFEASSIRVAEAAKVIENTQRDINIALMNELAIIFERLEIPTSDVLAAAGSKWNFLTFSPGLVGGHCIGVDPYYLTAKAEEVGYHPEIILAGRRLNDAMSNFVAQKLVKMLIADDIPVKGAKVGVLGLTFKPNVSDIRNSKVFDLIRELEAFGIEVCCHDPLADPDEVDARHQIGPESLDGLNELDALILAVPHRYYTKHDLEGWCRRLNRPGVFIDLKAAFHGQPTPSGVRVWSL